ncbi:MAG TPA: FAD-binding oxidoreductase [Pirellulales bacterium]|nr:FAD-binding oxidoreductase [Pirellulales bacterium]
MTAAEDQLPLSSLSEPPTQEDVVDQVRDAYAAETPIYPIGGGTSLAYGLPGRSPGIGLRLTGLNRIVDYPARDMTITVEAGITLTALGEELGRQGQRLPIDAGEPDRATLGGLIAANFSGPRRYGYGTLRDYVIGIGAVDGRGTPFKAGGRVVKNVAGYDLCKLLTGSLGSLAVITQVTLKVRPVPEATAFVRCSIRNWQEGEALLTGLIASRTTPAAVELLRGPHWSDEPFAARGETVAQLWVGFEGSRTEVNWQIDELRREWHAQPGDTIDDFRNGTAEPIWHRLAEFGAAGPPLVIKAGVLPSSVTTFMETLIGIDGDVSIQAHAGNGIVVAALPDFSLADAAKVLVQTLQPAAVAAGGNVVVWSCAAGELTRQAAWGAALGGADLMRSVKQQFDPKSLLNPGRCAYG